MVGHPAGVQKGRSYKKKRDMYSEYSVLYSEYSQISETLILIHINPTVIMFWNGQ